MKPAVFLLPNGHKIEVAPDTVLSRGTKFMGIDLVTILDAEHRDGITLRLPN